MEKLYTAQEIAEIIRCSLYTARRKITSGEFGETYNSGKQHFVYESGLQAYLKSRTSAPIPYAKHLGGGCAPKRKKVLPGKLTFI